MIEFIYVIENKITNKLYVGRTKNPQVRKRSHFSELRKNTHSNPKLQAAFNKYGESSFEFKVVDEAQSKDICKKEEHWFNIYKCDTEKLYNCHFKSYGGPIKTTPHTIESANKIREALKNNTRTYIFNILDERYNGVSLRKLAQKYNVGANTILSYTEEWEKLRNKSMPKSVQSLQTIQNVKNFVNDFLIEGKSVFRRLTEYKLTRKSLKKYLPMFNLSFEQVLIRN